VLASETGLQQVVEIGFRAGVARSPKPGYRSLETAAALVDVGELYTDTNSCGITLFPCDSAAFLSINQSIHLCFRH